MVAIFVKGFLLLCIVSVFSHVILVKYWFFCLQAYARCPDNNLYNRYSIDVITKVIGPLRNESSFCHYFILNRSNCLISTASRSIFAPLCTQFPRELWKINFYLENIQHSVSLTWPKRSFIPCVRFCIHTEQQLPRIWSPIAATNEPKYLF